MTDRRTMESIFKENGCSDFKWMDPGDVIVSEWVRFKCMFGCGEFGKAAACPPNLPDLDFCRKLFAGYRDAVLFHFEGDLEDPEDRHAWTKGVNDSLLAVERAVFLAGHYKAIVIYVDPCNICGCGECVPDKNDCRNPKEARPSLEGLGVDVFGTARKQGYNIDVLTDFDQKMNRYGMLLIE
jgi:predicted metal-binding protein